MALDRVIEDIAQAVALETKKKNNPATAHRPITKDELKTATGQAREILDLIVDVIMNQTLQPNVSDIEIMNFINACRNLSQSVVIDKLAAKISDQANKTLNRDNGKSRNRAEIIHSKSIRRVQELLCYAPDIYDPQQQDADDTRLVKAPSTTVDIELPDDAMTNTVRDLFKAILKKYPDMEVKEAYDLARQSIDVIGEILMNSELRQVDQSEIADFIDACRNQQTGNIFLGAINKKLEEIIKSTKVRDEMRGDGEFKTIESRSKDRVQELALFKEPEVPANSIAVPAAKQQTIFADVKQI